MAAISKVDIIIDSLRNRILSGEFGEGKLPSFRRLVVEYETSQETMNKAMQTLQAEGLLISSGAKGVFINHKRIRMPKIIKDFFDYINAEGLEAKEEFLQAPEEIEPTPELKKIMNLKKTERVLQRIRLQGTTTTPLRIVNSYYPVSLFSKEMLESFMKDPHHHTADEIKSGFNKTIQHISEEVIVRLPTTYEQEILKIVRTNPVIETRLTNYTADKKTVVMYNCMILNANHFILSYKYNVDDWS